MHQNQRSKQYLCFLGQQNYSWPEETQLDPSSEQGQRTKLVAVQKLSQMVVPYTWGTGLVGSRPLGQRGRGASSSELRMKAAEQGLE